MHPHVRPYRRMTIRPYRLKVKAQSIGLTTTSINKVKLTGRRKVSRDARPRISLGRPGDFVFAQRQISKGWWALEIVRTVGTVRTVWRSRGKVEMLSLRILGRGAHGIAARVLT